MHYSFAVCVAVAVALALGSHKGSAAPTQSESATIAQGIGSAASPQSDNATIVEFFRYTDDVYKVFRVNIVNILMRFVAGVKVPANSPEASTFQSYVDRGRDVQRTGSEEQQRDYVTSILHIIEKLPNLSTNFGDFITNMNNLVSVTKDFDDEETKLHNKLVGAATVMEAKLSPSTVAREQELFNLITEYKEADFQHQTRLVERILTFKNRY